MDSIGTMASSLPEPRQVGGASASFQTPQAPPSWSPLSQIGRGVAIGRYTPKVQTPVPNIDTPINIGDELYVFEAHVSGKWFRGYIVTPPSAHSTFNQPLPKTKTQNLNNAALKPLDFGVKTGVFPASIVAFREHYDFTPDSQPSSLRDSTVTDSSALSGRINPPAIPALRLGNETPTLASEPLVDDITSVVKEWFNTYVYHHFLFGNYKLVQSIQEAIRDLYDIRRRLMYGLLTKTERIIARKKAVWEIARVTKMLGRGIIVREPATGEIMSGREGPVRLAQEQVLLALAPNYPDHAFVGDISKVATMPKHILVDFRSCSGQIYGRNLSVELYLRTKSQRLTESFKIKIRQDTVLEELSAVLFRDLPISITKDDVYLVATLFEEVPLKGANPSPLSAFTGGAVNAPGSAKTGPMVAQPARPVVSNLPPKQFGRRGVAAGAADVSRLFRMEESIESPFVLRMYATYFAPNEPSDDNRGWGELADRIIRGRTAGVAVTPRAEQIVCTVKEFEAASVHHIENLSQEDSRRAIGFSKSLYINALSENRNDLYLHLGKITLTNAQHNVPDYLLLSVSSASGNKVIKSASNDKRTNVWDSTAAFNNEAMGEMVYVSNFEKDESLIIDLYVSGQHFAQTTMPLWHGNRVWSGKRTINLTRDGATVATVNSIVDFVGNGYNTDVFIDKVLNWRLVYETNGLNDLIATLSKFRSIDVSEFVKFFHDVLDAIFEIISEFNNGNPEHNDLLMQAFVAVVSTLEKVTSRSKDFVYLGNDYLDNRFNYGGLSNVLLQLMERCIRESATQGPQNLINIFRVAEYLARIIALSASIDSNIGKESHAEASLLVRRGLRNTVEALKPIVAKEDKSIVELQFTIVKNTYNWLSSFRHIVSSDELAQLLIELTDNMRTDHEKINVQRLLLIKDLSTSWLYKQSKYRSHLTSYSVKWTLDLWVGDNSAIDNNRREQIRLLCGIFAAQFEIVWPVRMQEPDVCKRYGQLLPLAAKVYTDLLDHFEQSRRLPCTIFSPLFPKTHPFEVRPIDSIVTDAVFDECLMEMGIVFTLLVNIARYSEGSLIDGSLTDEQLSEVAFNLLRACSAMLNSVAFPKTWISLLVLHHDTVLGCLDYLSVLMKRRFIPSPDDAEQFNPNLWYSFLSCILQLAGSEAIAVEYLPEQKRAAIWRISRDIRGRAAVLLRDVWESIGWMATEEDKARFGLSIFGGFQVQMFGGETSLVQEVLNLCLVRHPTAQAAAVHILQSMIVSEWTLNEDLSGLQREVIASLDDIYQKRTYLPESYEKKTFISTLRGTFNADREDEAYPYITRFMDDVDEFLDLQLDLYNIPPGDSFNDDRIFHALNVLSFLKDVDRMEIFSRYVSDIAQWNRGKQNHTQTGLALELLASAYQWSYDIRLEASEHPKFPAQLSFERKEALYEDIIQSYTRGKAFEKAIDATKELIHAYETVAYDFKKLASATRVLGKLYDSVDNVERYSPSYFRVAYIGVGFPRALRDRQFIFEGNTWEKLESIHDRLNKLYPGATIVNSESQAKSDGQYLYVTTVTPEPIDINGPRYASLPASAKEYLARRNMKYFSFSRPLPGNTSQLDLWVEKTIYETYESFPTIVKRSEVRRTTVEKLSPLQNAVKVIEQKTTDLLELETLFKVGKADQAVVSRLDLVLSGAVDSPVNGGVQIYRQFLEDEGLKADPIQSSHITALELAFLEYAATIQRCLSIHGRAVPPSLRPLHQSLMQLFERNFAQELAILSNLDSNENVKELILNSPYASMTDLTKVDSIVSVGTDLSRQTSVSSRFDSSSIASMAPTATAITIGAGSNGTTVSGRNGIAGGSPALAGSPGSGSPGGLGHRAPSSSNSLSSMRSGTRLGNVMSSTNGNRGYDPDHKF
uniref:ARAD1B13552p n=1 Tax=Blastobotrys adeninivorans TaxID=409370 RepID=A0A060T669_BLAAD